MTKSEIPNKSPEWGLGKNQKSKITLILVLLFCSSFSRSTTFDGRADCEASIGVWRDFGSSCADECEAQLDEFSMCAQVVTSGCDCGKSRCWNDEKNSCVALRDYKKIFDARRAEEKERLEAEKKQREEEAKEDQAEMARNLSKQEAANNQAAPTQSGKESVIEKLLDKPTAATPPAPVAGEPVVEIPPLFLQQQKAKEEAEKKKSDSPAAPAIPGLPVIPLPK
ncbi:MAG: hypothetical protein FJX34_04060 [Alphaproteobacteria bacterium]|nr:hypothetical protein [Alphaproteobacteria bacterium]